MTKFSFQFWLLPVRSNTRVSKSLISNLYDIPLPTHPSTIPPNEIMGVRRLFPGEGKIFAQKKPKKILKKFEKHTILVGKGGGASPADAHEWD